MGMNGKNRPSEKNMSKPICAKEADSRKNTIRTYFVRKSPTKSGIKVD